MTMSNAQQEYAYAADHPGPRPHWPVQDDSRPADRKAER